LNYNTLQYTIADPRYAVDYYTDVTSSTSMLPTRCMETRKSNIKGCTGRKAILLLALFSLVISPQPRGVGTSYEDIGASIGAQKSSIVV